MRTLAERLKERRAATRADRAGSSGTNLGRRRSATRASISRRAHRRPRARAQRDEGVGPQRDYRDLDDSLEIGTRNIALALRKLRRFAREARPRRLDLDGTVQGTARNAGLLDLKFQPERHNAVKVLLFLDISGSMDEHVRLCELFSAARAGTTPRALLLRLYGVWRGITRGAGNSGPRPST